MEEQYARQLPLIGEEGQRRLQNSRVIVFGIGGVGSFAAEAVARAGVGTLTLVDPDAVAPSNLNRQLIALHSTLGRNKAEVMAARVKDIDPSIAVTALPVFADENNLDGFALENYDFVLDCIDSLSSKIALIVACYEKNVRVISAMGAGNKLAPERLEIADIAATSVCPLARQVRLRLRKAGIEHLPVVYSEEEPVVRERVTASISFVPSTAGELMASYVIRELIK